MPTTPLREDCPRQCFLDCVLRGMAIAADKSKGGDKHWIVDLDEPDHLSFISVHQYRPVDYGDAHCLYDTAGAYLVDINVKQSSA